jgi:acyl-coenzyme A thioesterase PaaI-like protein
MKRIAKEIEPMKRIPMPKIEGYHCFACGTRNPHGLNMSFYLFGDSVRSDVTLSGDHVGWENIAHGGIISTVLDEVMGWAVIAFRRTFFVTRSMEVRYLRPVQVHMPLTAVGRVDGEAQSSSRSCRVKGVLLDPEGNRLAEAQAEMAFLSPKRVAMIPHPYRSDMERIFEQVRQLLTPDRP